MKDGKKNGFFSWLSTSMRKKKIVKIKENTTSNTLREDNICPEKKLSDMNNFLILKENYQKENKKIPNKNINDTKTNRTKLSFIERLKLSLQKTKKFFGTEISRIFLSKKIDHALFKELEEKMLLADIGINTTNQIIKNLINDINHNELKDPKKVYFLLKKHMNNILMKVEKPLQISNHIPFIILVVGVNGTGKTTTSSKLAKKYKLEGKSVMLAAADTFRAAGIEQLQILGKLNDIPVISQRSGSDPSAVIFDAIKSAQAKKIEVLIIDTAGRLHNKLHLMEELKKIVRVIKKIDVSAPHETMLIIDACNGQNTIKQTEIFHNVLNITGIVITKLDGTAKGGIIFALSDQFSIPIRYIGIGEKTRDLGVFNSHDFIESLFS